MATSIASFTEYVATDVHPCPDVIIERQVLNTIIEFCEKTHLLVKEFDADISDETPATPNDYVDITLTDIGGTNYFQYLKPVIILRFTLDGVPYIPEYRLIIDDIDDSNFAAAKEESVMYFSFPDNATLRVYDRSTSDENLHVVMAVKPLRSSTTVDDFLMEDWLDTIVAGVKYRILGMPAKEWSDMQSAALFYVEWRRGLSKAKMRVLRDFSGYPLEVTPQSFGQIDWNA